MPTEEVIEEDVQEVRCAVTGVPLPSIPAWYAGVRVKFISDAVRQRSARTNETATSPSSSADTDEGAPRPSLLAGEDEGADTTLLEDTDIETDEVDEPDVEIDPADPLEADEEG